MAIILRPCQGVSVFRNPHNGFVNLVVHYTADPAKRGKWAEEESAIYAGGMQSLEWLQEYEIDFEAEARKQTFWAFKRERNVIEPFRVPSTWDLWLSFDFGQTDPTAVLFYAQNPMSKEVVVWNEIYVTNTPVAAISQMVYEKLANERMLPSSGLVIENHIVDAVGDPSGASYALEYGQDPFPIPVRTKGFKTPWRLNDRRVGEAKVNEGFCPSFICCGRRWFPAGQKDMGLCGACKRPRPALPMVTIMDGRAPNLVRTLPLIHRVLPSQEGYEAPERDEKLEDHACDSLRYGLMRTPYEMPEGQEEQSLLTTPSHKLSAGDYLQKMRMYAQARQDLDAEEPDEDTIIAAELFEGLLPGTEGAVDEDGLYYVP